MKEDLHRQNKQKVTKRNRIMKENLQKQYLVSGKRKIYEMW